MAVLPRRAGGRVISFVWNELRRVRLVFRLLVSSVSGWVPSSSSSSSWRRNKIILSLVIITPGSELWKLALRFLFEESSVLESVCDRVEDWIRSRSLPVSFPSLSCKGFAEITKEETERLEKLTDQLVKADASICGLGMFCVLCLKVKFRGVLTLLGMRFTYLSVPRLPPPLSVLMDSFSRPWTGSGGSGGEAKGKREGGLSASEERPTESSGPGEELTSPPVSPPPSTSTASAVASKEGRLEMATKAKKEKKKEKPENEKLHTGGRAWTKHAVRSSEKWWGEAKGPQAELNRRAEARVSSILKNRAWMNFHRLPDGNEVFEVRNLEGYGARWAFPPAFADPSPSPSSASYSSSSSSSSAESVDASVVQLSSNCLFRGFLEPHRDGGHEDKWRH
uniref:Uncharacterized protein n=1 Tax=Chromera velia CCMP2878 TaxID=1169474 RepID=A0A0G4HW25_9ALVE|eukprot:Cvel_8953.t1-p1 / transcript=Cvel_8953.t1 / gene=Cvel_8953 / organism=Chromera_velia_CCMP2878 / gene_product=hypothetical protein / transcript_product=hypothetical protein / location=Cvel_scaffold504:67187-70133(+) / protein_length=393 / sequence_SO=supercontig / SO=protein_coding / is_pseudo=false